MERGGREEQEGQADGRVARMSGAETQGSDEGAMEGVALVEGGGSRGAAGNGNGRTDADLETDGALGHGARRGA